MSAILVEVTDGVATVTLNRPDRRNALNGELLVALRDTMGAVDADDAVAAIVLTGADPAFCAGLDLKALGAGETRLSSATFPSGSDPEPVRSWGRTEKPVIGAVNGPAVTGGLEVALQCDFLVASERAVFADTHARVGVLPAWGLTVLLSQAVGIRKAKEMSLTGNFMTADEALRWRLVNHVVAHDDLLPFARRLAADIAGNDQRAARRLLAEYDEVTATTPEEGLRIEARIAAGWNGDGAAVADVERRRESIVERGRSQI
ncbi:MAG TPA: enoyl-CoA hydratase [Acidimicrobiales bacterium]|nr:enoyl-CoA hydratase [Acidimicrobiales bacterium]